MSDSENENTKPYCGFSNKLPKGHHFGTMVECANINQVRRYGKFKIDSKIAEEAKKMKKKPVGKKDYFKMLFRVRARMKKLLPQINKLKEKKGADAKVKPEFRDELKKLEQEYSELRKEEIVVILKLKTILTKEDGKVSKKQEEKDEKERVEREAREKKQKEREKKEERIIKLERVDEELRQRRLAKREEEEKKERKQKKD